MAPLVSDIQFPELRKDAVHVRNATQDNEREVFRLSPLSPACNKPNFDDDGFTDEGTIVPGIMNMGCIFRVGSFTGLPAPYTVPFGWGQEPTSGADIIVTILYQHSAKTLRRFLDCADDVEFRYLHKRAKITDAKGNDASRPFLITRQGPKVEAGFPDGYIDGQVSQAWKESICYTIGTWGEWVQTFSKNRTSKDRSNSRIVKFDNENSSSVERQKWEAGVAVKMLQHALISHRWTQQPGFQIVVDEMPRGKESSLTPVEDL